MLRKWKKGGCRMGKGKLGRWLGRKSRLGKLLIIITATIKISHHLR